MTVNIIDGKIIGMGRIIGDGARIFYIQDVVIHSNFQGKGIGTTIMEKLIAYIEKFGSQKRPNEFRGNGMIMNISK